MENALVESGRAYLVPGVGAGAGSACWAKKEAIVGFCGRSIDHSVHRARLVDLPRTISPSWMLGRWLGASG